MASDYSNLPEINCPICSSPHFSDVTIRFDSGRIVQCSDCHHFYLNPPLTDDILTRIYQSYNESPSDDTWLQIIDGWFRDSNGPYQFALNIVDHQFGFPNKRVLDVGCGPGRFLHECSKRGAHPTGNDISPTAIRLAKQYFSLDLIPKTLDLAIADGDLSLCGFDLVFAFEVIEHVRRPADFVGALYELLAPGGLLFISTPNFYLFHVMGNAAPSVRQWPEHLQFFEPASLVKCLERFPFASVQVTTLNPLTHGDRQKQVIMSVPRASKVDPFVKTQNGASLGWNFLLSD